MAYSLLSIKGWLFCVVVVVVPVTNTNPVCFGSCVPVLFFWCCVVVLLCLFAFLHIAYGAAPVPNKPANEGVFAKAKRAVGK